MSLKASEFKRFGVTLKPLSEDMLETVRQWRNDPEVAKHMLTREYISAEQQVQWFKRMSQDPTQMYWVAWFKEQPIGVASLTEINTQSKTVAPGMYIYPQEFKNNIVPFCVAFALNDYAFEELKLETLIGKIFTDNESSLRFHEKCGYKKFMPNTGMQNEPEGLQWFCLSQDDYETAKAPIARFIRY